MKNRNKPLIGVTTSARRGHIMWFFISLALRMVKGKSLRITALNKEAYEKCDGYIISGGVDIDPKAYGQKNTASVDVEVERDNLEKKIITHALKHKKPLMGICRGAQMINVVKEGTLYQDARDFYEDFVPTSSTIGRIFVRRKIKILKKSLLHKLFKNKENVFVNSIHHQAIDKLGKGLKIVAKDELGIVQAIESEDFDKVYIIGVQWHPEFMIYNKDNINLFRNLVSNINKRA